MSRCVELDVGLDVLADVELAVGLDVLEDVELVGLDVLDVLGDVELVGLDVLARCTRRCRARRAR
eukprot:5759441-Pyramimonas_sp.AAC.1